MSPTASTSPCSLPDAMQRLYALEINCGVSSFYDGGWDAWIGDEMNGRHEEANFLHLEEVGPWLIEAAKTVVDRWAKERRVMDRRACFRVLEGLK